MGIYVPGGDYPSQNRNEDIGKRLYAIESGSTSLRPSIHTQNGFAVTARHHRLRNTTSARRKRSFFSESRQREPLSDRPEYTTPNRTVGPSAMFLAVAAPSIAA